MNAKKDFTSSFTVDRTPEEVFAAINDVRGWWTGRIEGRTAELGDEFTYRYEDLHHTKQTIVESVPGKRIVWRVSDGRLTFVADPSEWNGTAIVFEIARRGDRTEVRLTHVGLNPDRECYGACSGGWREYFDGSLRRFIEGQPKERRRRTREAPM